MDLGNFASNFSEGNFFSSLKKKAEENLLPDGENATPIWEILKQSVDAGRDVLASKSAEVFRASRTGQRVEGEAKKQAIVDIVRGPVGIVLVGLLLMFVILKMRR